MSATPEPADTYEAPAVPGWPAEVGLVGMSVAAAIGMGRLFADASFLPVVLLAVLVSHGISLACRRRGIGPLATLGVSVAGLVLFVTWVVEPHVSLLPGPATWQAASLDMREAWGRFSEVVAPAKVTRGFVLGAVLGSWVSAFVADLFAFRARTRVEAVVPSFTVFLFGALLGSDRHRLAAALLYLAAVLTFVVLAEISAAPRARPWLAGRRGPGEAALLRTGLGMAGVAAALAVVVGPQLPGAYAKGVLGVADGNGRTNGTRVTLSPLVEVRGRLVSQSSVELFTVATDADPTYWRITSLDRFDGNIWSSLSNYRPAGTRLPGLGPDATRGDTAKAVQQFEISGLSSIWLPAAYRPERLSPSGKVRFDPDSASLATDKATSDGLRYTVESALPRLTAEELTTVGASVPANIGARYLELPASVSRQVRQEARRVTDKQPTPYGKAKALQDYFRTNFTYSLQVAQGHDQNAIDQFLASRQGYCEQFAGTYAAMARSLGLPARVAVGFTPGTKGADGRWHVTGKEAHAWPEVYLSGYGWVAFEPTPGRGLPGAEGYTEVPPAQAADSTVDTVPQTAPPVDEPAPAPEVTETTGPVQEERSVTGRRMVVAGALLALVVVYGAGVPLAKRRGRQRRRAGAATAADRVLVAWADATEDMAAAGMALRPEETAAEFAHRVGRSAGPAGAGLVRLADDVSAASWSATGVAQEVAVRAEAEAAGIAAELTAQATRRERIRRALDPRPLLAASLLRPAPGSAPGDVDRAA
ncbi:MAG: transglutaminaseTgpA domain-containing protein [Acidimicrobiales bacterium]